MEGTAPVDTREAISREFMRAYARERLDRITVKGLCAAVPVARTTFYAHYRNVLAVSMRKYVQHRYQRVTAP